MTSAEQQLFVLPQAAPAVDSGKAAAGALVIVVYGKPITQGSKVRNRFGGVRDDNATTLKPWRDNVRSAARAELGDDGHPGFGTAPVSVVITYRFERPTGHYGTGRNAHLVKDSAPPVPANRGSGDIDKLQRACFDSLTDAAVWRDDSQVVDVAARKRWADDDNPPGADIVVTVWTMP